MMDTAPQVKRALAALALGMFAAAITQCVSLVAPNTVFGDEATTPMDTPIPGKVFELGEDSNYAYDKAAEYNQASPENTLGNASFVGVVAIDETSGEIPSFDATNGNIGISYTFDSKLANAAAEEWHLTEDGSKTVADIELPSNVKSGAIILQTSRDGQRWLNDLTIADAFANGESMDNPIYTTNDMQLTNGFYYRLIIAYETEVRTGQGQFLLFRTDVFDYRKHVEVYEFYLHDSSQEADAAQAFDAASQEKQALGNLTKAAKENAGYYGSADIDINDPHYGWSLGRFYVGGYTSKADVSEGESPVFLKNVGDKVMLWFELGDGIDIDKLNNNEALSIANDDKGYDQYFQTEKTDMGRGTLIIRQTDEKGESTDPIIYTNFLEAFATTSANTVVKLFEEGDYEVALDYKIKSTPRKVLNIDIVPEYSDYRISFKFSIRNGNCMVYPFDVVTGSQLSDGESTPNGFKLDMAKSRYLSINVKRSFNGETVFNRPAKDGEMFKEEGTYQFTVKNKYTDEVTTKTITVAAAKGTAQLDSGNEASKRTRTTGSKTA